MPLEAKNVGSERSSTARRPQTHKKVLLRPCGGGPLSASKENMGKMHKKVQLGRVSHEKGRFWAIFGSKNRKIPTRKRPFPLGSEKTQNLGRRECQKIAFFHNPGFFAPEGGYPPSRGGPGGVPDPSERHFSRKIELDPIENPPFSGGSGGGLKPSKRGFRTRKTAFLVPGQKNGFFAIIGPIQSPKIQFC